MIHSSEKIISLDDQIVVVEQAIECLKYEHSIDGSLYLCFRIEEAYDAVMGGSDTYAERRIDAVQEHLREYVFDTSADGHRPVWWGVYNQEYYEERLNAITSFLIHLQQLKAHR